MKKSMILGSLMIIVGLMIGVFIYLAVNSYLDLGTVYVAKEEIDVHTPISSGQFQMEKQPKKNIPPDAITSAKQLEDLSGKLTRTVIVKSQVLQQALVSNAHNLREVNENISEDYVTATVPIENNDIPIDLIKRNDVISLIGIRKETTPEGGDLVIQEYISQQVLVLEPFVDQSSASGKLMVLIPRDEAPTLKRDIAVGKVYVVLDPKKFELKGK